jgi:hypothetical protein
VDSGLVLAYSSNSFFSKKFSGLLTSLEATSLGYSKDIACVFGGKALKKIKYEGKKPSDIIL